MKAIIFVVMFAVMAGCRPRPEPPLPSPLEGRLVDLTHVFDEETIYWPTEDGFQFREGFAGYTDAGFYYEAHSFCTAEHGGTHIDAPIHFAEGRQSVDEIPLNRLIGAAIVVDVTDSTMNNRDYQISIDDLMSWEEEHRRDMNDIIILFRTGFSRYWPDREQYMGTDRRGQQAVAELSFPGLHPEAAQWLVDHRTVKSIGIDTPSIDYGRSTHFESHQKLFGENIPVFENVANLDELPPYNFTVIALPMKIAGGSGGPLRIVGVVP